MSWASSCSLQSRTPCPLPPLTSLTCPLQTPLLFVEGWERESMMKKQYLNTEGQDLVPYRALSLGLHMCLELGISQRNISPTCPSSFHWPHLPALLVQPMGGPCLQHRVGHGSSWSKETLTTLISYNVSPLSSYLDPDSFTFSLKSAFNWFNF